MSSKKEELGLNALAGLTASSYPSFPEATTAVLEMMEQQMPDSAVFLSRIDKDTQIMTIIDARGDRSFGIKPGLVIGPNEAFCHYMVRGDGNGLVNDVAQDEVYKNLPHGNGLGISAYLGVPLQLSNGQSVGSLCAVSRNTSQYNEGQLKMVLVMARMLAYEMERQLHIEELQVLTEALKKEATTDALTGIPNRRLFLQVLDREWELTKRKTHETWLTVLDLDGFKAINDNHGHSAGDRVLEDIAKVLSSAVRGGDVVARLGGDEFSALLVGVGEKDALAASERMRKAIEKCGAEYGLELSASIGCVALYDFNTSQEAYDQADKIMYADKAVRKARR